MVKIDITKAARDAQSSDPNVRKKVIISLNKVQGRLVDEFAFALGFSGADLDSHAVGLDDAGGLYQDDPDWFITPRVEGQAFYSPLNAIHHSGDVRSDNQPTNSLATRLFRNTAQTNDVEVIKITTKLLPVDINALAYVSSIYDRDKFEYSTNPYARAMAVAPNGNSEELIRYDLKSPELLTCSALLVGIASRVAPRSNEWIFTPKGKAYRNIQVTPDEAYNTYGIEYNEMELQNGLQTIRGLQQALLEFNIQGVFNPRGR